MDEPVEVGSELLLFLGLFRGRGGFYAFLRFHMLHATEVFQNLAACTFFGAVDELHDFLHTTTHGLGFDIEEIGARHRNMRYFFVLLEKLQSHAGKLFAQVGGELHGKMLLLVPLVLEEFRECARIDHGLGVFARDLAHLHLFDRVV